MLSIGDLKKIEETDQQLGGQIRLSIGTLEKAADEAGDVNTAALVAQIAAVLDFSGSMEKEYNLHLSQPRPRRTMFGRTKVEPNPVDESQVALAISRALAVGAALDPDQVAQALFFDSVVSRAKSDIDIGNHRGWLGENVPNRQMGCTRLDLAVLETIRLAGEVLGNPAIARNAHLNGNWKPIGADMPMLVPLVTDGKQYDGGRTSESVLNERTRLAFRAASYCPIEFVIFYVGSDLDGLRFVRELDDLSGTFTDAINVVEFTGGMRTVTDERFADETLKEFPGWVKSVRGTLLPKNFAA